MIHSTSTRERRDWTLLVFIIPIGVILMLIAGKIASRLVPEWSVNAGMQSQLDPNTLPMQQDVSVQPILPAILTPLGWFDTFLTPGAGSGDQMVFPPFVVFESSPTPKATLPPPTVATQPSPTAPTSTPPTVIVSPPPVTGTSKPPGGETPTSSPTATQPTSSPTATQPTPSPTATGTPSTPPAGSVPISVPPQIDVNSPPDGVQGDIPSGLTGTYIIVDLGGTPVIVSNKPDGNYDLIFYEYIGSPGNVLLDNVIVGIATDTSGSYYEVFNWGDNVRDENTNVDTNKLPADPTCTGAEAPECDNRVVPITSLYPGTGISTGILIDVDNASGKPPEGSYGYLVIISPVSLDAAQVDAVVVDEVPGGKVAVAAVQAASSVAEETSQPAEVAPVPVVEEDPAPAVEEPPAPPADEGSSPSTEEAPAEPPP